MVIYEVDENLPRISVSSKVVLIFDIDNTLYKETREIKSDRRRHFYLHLRDALQCTEEEFFKLCDEYTKEYGLSQAGIYKNHKIDKEIIRMMNKVAHPIHMYVKPNEKFIRVLQDYPTLSYFAFTNGNYSHAEKALKALGFNHTTGNTTANISRMDAFCVKYTDEDMKCKPHKEAFKLVHDALQMQEGTVVLFFDDSIRNIEGCKAVGWKGIIVEKPEEIDRIVEEEIKKVIHLVV